MPARAGAFRRPRLIISGLVTLALLVPLGWMWQTSRVPPAYSVMDMGYLDYGGGPSPASANAGHQHSAGHQPSAGAGTGRPTSVSALIADPRRPADVKVDLVTRQQNLTIGGQSIPGYTINDTSPGPTIEAVVGQLVEVTVSNASVEAGIAVHWHGVDVPNAMDGVAGVTQDAVPVGGTFTYRFVVDRAGTYWYHSHQVSHEQVLGGLFGALVVRDKPRPRDAPAGVEIDVVATAHTYRGIRTLNGQVGVTRVLSTPGQHIRLRVINTDNGPMSVWANTAFRLIAVDSSRINEPSVVTDRSVVVTAGGRADLELVVPADGAPLRVQLAKATAMIFGRADADPAEPPEPLRSLDLLQYGTPAPLGFDPASADRSFDYTIGRRPGFVRGRPGLWWSINGHLYPNVPMYVVREGDVVRMHIENHSGEVHPMHLHGHVAVVLARDNVPSTGSPWRVDSLNVEDGESFDLAFVADNPGIWMDHCHNLKHAAEGMVAHLMYEGISAPYLLGGSTHNEPE